MSDSEHKYRENLNKTVFQVRKIRQSLTNQVSKPSQGLLHACVQDSFLDSPNFY